MLGHALCRQPSHIVTVNGYRRQHLPPLGAALGGLPGNYGYSNPVGMHRQKHVTRARTSTPTETGRGRVHSLVWMPFSKLQVALHPVARPQLVWALSSNFPEFSSR